MNIKTTIWLLVLSLAGNLVLASVTSRPDPYYSENQDDVQDFAQQNVGDGQTQVANKIKQPVPMSNAPSDLMQKVSGGLADFVNGPLKKPILLDAPVVKGAVVETGVPAPSAGARSVAKQEQPVAKGGFFGLDLAKLLLNPVELVKAISEYFLVPLDKLILRIGKSTIWGLEAFLSPALAGVKIIERVFIPNACLQKQLCKLGAYLAFFREGVIQLTPNFLEQSLVVKSLTDGIIGRDCELTFQQCEPKLKKDIEAMRSTGATSGQTSIGPEPASSSQPSTTEVATVAAYAGRS